MARGALLGLGALLVLGGGGALGYGVTRKATGGMTPEGTAAMGAAMSELENGIKNAKDKVEAKAKLLSQASELRGAIGTNYATTMERFGKEIRFKPEGSEMLTLVQVPKGGTGAVEVVMRLPETEKPPAGTDPAEWSPKPGPRDGKAGNAFTVKGDRATIAAHISSVVALDEALDKTAAEKLDGFLTVEDSLSLKPAIDKLASAGIDGKLLLAGETIVVGNPPATGETKDMPLASQPGAKLVVSVPPLVGGMPMPIVGAGAGAAGLGLILVIAGMMGGKKKPEAQPQGQLGATMMTGQTALPPGGSIGAAASMTAASYVAPGMSDTQQALSMSAANLDAGQVIGRWQIIRRLGSGGMADVFLAHARGEAGFEKQVALKVMHSHLARNERAVSHFLDEARLAARVQHPNVVAIQDLGKIGNDYVIVMDYVDGVDLERLLSNARAGNRPVPVEVGLGIMCRICDGLNAAHNATTPDGVPLGIIHRDVKSANVLVSKQGAVKVVDFGIAKAAAQVHFTIAGETKGTPSMMAPEQRVGELVDVRADVYSVSAVGYEVMTGHGVNLDLAALAHLGVENWPHLPLPTSLRAGLPPEIDELLLGAMSFERDKRPKDCAAFESLFESVMKRNNLSCSDKDIARWMDGELAVLSRAADTADTTATKLARPT